VTVVDPRREKNNYGHCRSNGIENLRPATLADLRSKFCDLFQKNTRCRHREHLFRCIAWRLQALAEGDLTERAFRRAQRLHEMLTCEKLPHGIS
jgi:hypothetical protein